MEKAGAIAGVVENEKLVGTVVVVVDVLVVVVGDVFPFVVVVMALVVDVARGSDAIDAAGSAMIATSAPIDAALNAPARRSLTHPPLSDDLTTVTIGFKESTTAEFLPAESLCQLVRTMWGPPHTSLLPDVEGGHRRTRSSPGCMRVPRGPITISSR